MNHSYARRTPPFASAPWRSPRDQLSFRVRRRGDIVLLAVRGQADAFTLALWRQQVRAAADTVAGPQGALVVDATRLDFLSVRSLAALSDEAQEYRREGIEIFLVTAEPAIARIARADTRTALLPVRSTVVSALTAVHLRDRTPDVVSADGAGPRGSDERVTAGNTPPGSAPHLGGQRVVEVQRR
ncbi:STAS domain-containing protein [Nocardia sp. NPDC002869]|uniref:STAS domain-containing protein n=1 Tax=Nocardia sp. NPDC002869 TaxID=3161032 RepID=UPI00398CF5D4